MLSFVHKYHQIYLISLQEALMYRGEAALWLIIDAISMLSMIFLWLGVYSYGDSLLDYSLASLLSYYVFGFFFARLTETHFEEHAVEDVISGNIAKHFVKPTSLYQYYLTIQFAWKSMGLVTTVLPVIFILTLFYPLWLTNLTLDKCVILGIFVVLGLVLDSLLSFLIVALSFFLDQGRSLCHFKWMVVSMFSGSLLPLDAYPPVMKTVAQFLPFQYLYYVPTSIFQGSLPLTTGLIGIGKECIWLIIIGVITAIFWKQAQHRFTAVGN